jgi:hypothetical protein
MSMKKKCCSGKCHEVQDSDKLSRTMYIAGLYQEIKGCINNSGIRISVGDAQYLADLISTKLGSTRLERI